MANSTRPPDDPSSAPESGTVRDDTSGNNPSPPDRDTRGRGDNPGQPADGRRADDPSLAPESK